MRLLKSNKVFFLSFVVFITGSTANFAQQWQWPERGKNLKVLPEMSNAQQLRSTMISFVRGLGVRCTHCHVGEDGQPLSTYDFESDEKPAKNTARIMLKMRDAINNKFLTQLGKDKAHLLQVRCITCHQGQPRPLTLDQVLSEIIAKEGVQAAIKKYHELRDRFYGGLTYDFREGPLNALGYQLLAENDLNGAIAIFKLNVEMNPNSFNVYDSLAEAYMKTGNKEQAIANYKKSLELNPQNRNATKMLEELSHK